MADDKNFCAKKRRHQRQSKWSELPEEIAELVLKKFASTDILRFKAVCSSWKYAANSYIVAPYYKPLPQPPWLMLSKAHEDNSCRFFSVEEKKVYTIKNTLFKAGSCCVGSSHGWLVIMNKDSIINLLNPVSGESIQFLDIRSLGGFSNLSSSHVSYVVLSSEPSRQNKFLLTIYTTNKNPITFKHENNAWCRLLLHQDPISHETAYQDGKLFAVSLGVDVVHVLDFDKSVGDMPTITEYILAQCWPSHEYMTRDDCIAECYCLMESLGEIFRMTAVMVGRLDGISDIELYFEVYKMSFMNRPEDNGVATWKKVEDLGNRFIIWCREQSPIALSASDFTQFEENSIYYYHRGGIFMFNLRDKVVKPCYKFDESLTNSITDAEPFWIVPNLSLK